VLDVCLAAGLPLSPPFSSSEVLLCCTIVTFERELCIWHNADPQYQHQSLAFNYNIMMAPIVNMSYSMIPLVAFHPSSSFFSIYIIQEVSSFHAGCRRNLLLLDGKFFLFAQYISNLGSQPRNSFENLCLSCSCGQAVQDVFSRPSKTSRSARTLAPSFYDTTRRY
jgi:hypothetical protein